MRELPGFGQSDSWLVHRAGRITGSRIADVMNTLKGGGEGSKRKGYRMEILAARLTGKSATHYVSMEMQRGLEMEQTAIEMYQMATHQMVIPVGFVLHPEWDFTGATPDGLVGSDGLIEVKCPKSETLLEWRLSDVIPEEYIFQMQWQMACTERKWCDFYGYDDRLPSPISHLIKRVERDDKRIAEISSSVLDLNEQIEAMIEVLGLPPTHWMPYTEMTKQAEPDLPDQSAEIEADWDAVMGERP
jgi:putative phage-type endonuclease